MKKRAIRMLSILLAVVMLLGNMPLSVFAAEERTTTDAGESMTISASSAKSMAGSTVDVTILVEGNPGISSVKLNVAYGDILTLESVTYNTAMGGIFQQPQTLGSPVVLNWASPTAEYSQDGIFATLKFAVSEEAETGSVSEIKISYDPDDIYNMEEENIDNIVVVNGSVTVIKCLPGDINGDQKVNNKDFTRLFQYLSDWDVEVSETCLDVNNDGNINNKDFSRLFQYLSGWDVEIYCACGSAQKCDHALELIPYKAATCEAEGNVRYYHCTTCGKNYSDDKGSKELTRDQITLKALGHTEVTISGKEPSYEEAGYTESVACSACGKVFIEPTVLPKLEKNLVNVIYYLAGPDQDQYLVEYLKDKDLSVINPNKSVYDTTTQGHELAGIGPVIPGYRFKGWVDMFGDPFRSIEKGRSGNIEIYATWEKITYDIIFDSPDVDVPASQQTTFTIDKGAQLKDLEQYGYNFTGWSTDDGFLIKEIKPGTVGPVYLHANWTAKRNVATSYLDYGDPIIIEDAQRGQLLFVYNIGKIDKVPLNVIPDSQFHNMDIKEFNESLTVSNAVDSGMVEGINKMISNATTRSSGWTLTNEWEDMYTSTETVGTLKEKSDERTTTQGQVVGGKFFISNSEGGSTYVSNESGGSTFNSTKVTTEKSMGINGSYDKGTTKYCDAQLGVKTHLGGSAGVEAEAGVGMLIPAGVATAGVNGSVTVDGSVDGEAGIQNGRKDESAFHIDGSYSQYTGTVDYEEERQYYTSTASSDSNWNSTAGYEQSWESSTEESVTTAIKEQLSMTSEHSISKAVGETSSTTESKQDTFTNAEEYNTTFTYGTIDTTTTTRTVKDTFTVPGHYRYITVGTIHVYGVVGYDVATASYYTYCFNVLDDTTSQIWDYSKDDQTFRDCENGVVTFNIPFEVNEYVAGMVGKTNGLVIDYDGVVTGFEPTEDFDGTVVIPQYDRKVRTSTAVKVTSFTADSFDKVKDSLETLVLPSYITEIPDNAFEGFTKLKSVVAYGVTKIGKNAFAGCTSLEKFYVDTAITQLGENAFEDVPEITVAAYDSAVAESAVKSGARKVTLNIGYMKDSFDNREIVIGSDDDETNGVEVNPEYFALISNGKSYNNLKIVSKAKETMISGIVFANNATTPMTLESDKILLARVKVLDSPSFALVIKKDAEVQLLGDIDLKTASDNAVLSRDVIFSKAEQSTTSRIFTNGGKYLVCGQVTNKNFLYDDKEHNRNVEPTVISEEEFKLYFETYIVTFDANGGTVGEQSRVVTCGKEFGTLPIPTRDGHVFDGWYDVNGNKVTETTSKMIAENMTVTAKWTLIEYKVSWNAGTGYSITVSRTSSPVAGAATGTLSSGDKVYYGDVLSVSYGAATGYSLESKGNESITVTGNVTETVIFATATPNEYTYNIVYKSSNGTALSTSTVSHTFGTTNSITPPAIAGYDTPAAQSVVWDSADAKTITFSYVPTAVSATTKSGYVSNDTYYKLKYDVTIDYRNRTANSVQIQVTWKASLSGKGAYNNYGQWFRASVGSVSTGNVNVVKQGTWGAASSDTRTGTGASGWITVPLNTTNATSVNLSVYYYQANYNGTDITPQYAQNMSATWAITIPAY